MMIEVGDCVERRARDWFTTPSAPNRIGRVVAKYHPERVAWSHSNQADWWRFDVEWDDTREIGVGYFACGLVRVFVLPPILLLGTVNRGIRG